MILESLERLYCKLSERGILDKPGWTLVGVSWGLLLDADGTLTDVVKEEMEVPVNGKDKKTKKVPVPMRMPARVTRTVGIDSNCLCDNSAYVFGVDNKGKPDRSKQCFDAFKAKHEQLLSGVDHPAAAALLGFIRGWRPESAAEYPALTEHFSEICAGGNIAFIVDGEYIQDIPEIAEACETEVDSTDEREGICLVTGKRAPIARVHPNITGFPGAQSSGASLVSFNDMAYESYGCEGSQGYNAHVGEYAAYAYTEALKWLLRNDDHHRMLGDTMTVFWAEDGEDPLAQFFGLTMDGMTDNDVKSAMRALAKGSSFVWQSIPLRPSNRFYVLGLAPNAARLSVRFFLSDTFGFLMKNMVAHMERMEIVKPSFETRDCVPFWQMLGETVNPNARDKKPVPILSGDLPRSVLQGLPYPVTLYQQVQLRLRAGDDISWGKASIIKAYLLKNAAESKSNIPYKEVLTVQLNEETNCVPYVLGRLFSILEGLQERAIDGITTTIRDRYFTSAFNMPYAVFPSLINLAQAHLKKLKDSERIYYDRRIQDLLCRLDSPYPKRLSLEEQGIFQIGYYHEKQYRYTKREVETNE